MKYMGSKSRIAKYIVPIIQEYIDKNEIKNYLEPFVGGANVIDKVKCDNKYGFDNNKYLIALLKQAQIDPSAFPKTIDKSTYDYVRQNYQDCSFDDWFIGLAGFCASYNAKWFGGYANDVKTKIGTVRNYTDEAIRNLVKQSTNLEGIKFKCRDFKLINTNKVNGFVVYNDIPYRNSTKYGNNEFDYEYFYAWCRKLSKNNIVLTSEYWMPDDFECIWQKEIKCTLDNNSRTDKVEKLFVWKGWLNEIR